MMALFSSLTTMLEASVFPAFIAAFAWGILSIILSPCHLAGIPLIMGHISLKSGGMRRNAVLMAFLFTAGIMITLAVIGMVTSALGKITGATAGWASYMVGVFLVVFGLHMSGMVSFHWFDYSFQPAIPHTGYLAAFLLGLVFGLALGPCTFAFIAPMIAIAFRTGGSDPVYAFMLFFFFALGHCSVIVLAGVLTEPVKRFLTWNMKSGGTQKTRVLFGILVLLSGIYIIIREAVI